MYTIEQFKIDLENMIDFLEKEVIRRKSIKNDYEHVGLIETIMIPEFKMLHSYAMKNIIFFYDKMKRLKSMHYIVDEFDFDDVVAKKVEWLLNHYQKLNEFSGGIVVYEYC